MIKTGPIIRLEIIEKSSRTKPHSIATRRNRTPPSAFGISSITSRNRIYDFLRALPM